MSNAYAAVSALIFFVVAFVHLARLLRRWPVQVGSYAVPMVTSWFGLAASSLLAIWGFMQFGH
jgi:hypothetical protein